MHVRLALRLLRYPYRDPRRADPRAFTPRSREMHESRFCDELQTPTQSLSYRVRSPLPTGQSSADVDALSGTRSQGPDRRLDTYFQGATALNVASRVVATTDHRAAYVRATLLSSQ